MSKEQAMKWLAIPFCDQYILTRVASCGLVAMGCAAFAQTGAPVQTAVPQVAAPTVLGPLILSPAQRRTLESVRSGLGSANDAPAPAGAKDGLREPSAVPDTLVVSGVVIRSGNRSTVWVNNEPLYGRATDSALRTLAGQAGVLQSGTRDMQAKARPGQVVDVLTGQAVDLLPPGAIRIIPPKAGAGSIKKE
jgi:hypothetical protein